MCWHVFLIIIKVEHTIYGIVDSIAGLTSTAGSGNNDRNYNENFLKFYCFFLYIFYYYLALSTLTMDDVYQYRRETHRQTHEPAHIGKNDDIDSNNISW